MSNPTAGGRYYRVDGELLSEAQYQKRQEKAKPKPETKKSGGDK